MFAKFSQAVSSFFYPSQPAPKPVAFEEEAYVIDNIELNPKLTFSEQALAIYKGLRENGYQRHVRSQLNTWAGVAQDPCLVRHSKHPGQIMFDGRQLSFQDADYFVNVSKAGDVAYLLKLKGSYYPVNIQDIPDPTMKNIHAQVVAPHLQKQLELQNRIVNKN